MFSYSLDSRFSKVYKEKTKCSIPKIKNKIFPVENILHHLFQEKLKQPFNEIFLWAVLSNVQQMATLFWKRGDEVLAKALMARHLYQMMIVRYQNENVYVDEKNHPRAKAQLRVSLYKQ